MERQKVLELVKKNVTNKNLFKHCLAVEAIMRAAASELSKRNGNAARDNPDNQDNKKIDEEKWAIAGLVHDIDYDMTAGDPSRHSLAGAEILEDSRHTT